MTTHFMKLMFMPPLLAALVFCSSCKPPGASTPRYQTAPLSRGDLVQHVTASGTLSALVSVDVGSQVSGKISALLVDEEFERVRNWHPDPALKSTTNNDLNIERLSQGVEIVGDVRIRHKSVHLVEVSADPTIAAGYVAWGMRRALVNDGIKVELETSDVVLRETDPDQLIVAFRDAYRDPKLQVKLNRILERYPNAIFIDMGWPSRNFEGKNVIRTFGSSAISSAIASNLLVNHEGKAVSAS